VNPPSISFTENGNLRAHYTKTTVRAGEVLRLTAVFQDTRRAPVAGGVTSGMVPEGKCSRSSERDQYAQCLDSHGHELFAPLSARGEFYATCQSGSLDTGSDAVLYRVHQLARRDLPLRVRLHVRSGINSATVRSLSTRARQPQLSALRGSLGSSRLSFACRLLSEEDLGISTPRFLS